MMTHKSLRMHFDQVSKLNQTKLIVEGLQEYRGGLLQNNSIQPDPQLLRDLDTNLAAMEEAIRFDAEEVASRTPAVEDTLECISDCLTRTMAKLHFISGLSWKEVGAITNVGEAAAKNRVYRAMKAAGIT